jgi:pimeloyl-ACP methyl ester carboxylesterase
MAHLLQHRAGAGAPLVLLHGLGEDWRAWSPILPALEERHDVIALDLPGHGAAPALGPGVRPTVDALADAVEAELDRLGVDVPHVVGNSVGGRVALELGVRQRARSVVALAPSGFEFPPERAWVFATDQALRLRARVAAPARHWLARHALTRVLALGGPHARAWRLPPAEAAHQIAAIATAPAYQDTLVWAAMLDVPVGLWRIGCPTRIAFGTLDILLGALTAPRFAAAIPGAELIALPGCGHVPMSDAPGLVAETVLGVT